VVIRVIKGEDKTLPGVHRATPGRGKALERKQEKGPKRGKRALEPSGEMFPPGFLPLQSQPNQRKRMAIQHLIREIPLQTHPHRPNRVKKEWWDITRYP
jgi:hypothetical protein